VLRLEVLYPANRLGRSWHPQAVERVGKAGSIPYRRLLRCCCRYHIKPKVIKLPLREPAIANRLHCSELQH
jgi:hypothetical protein